MATDNVHPPPYSQVVAQEPKDESKTPLSSCSPPHYNATAPPPYSATSPSKQNHNSPSREAQRKERKESFKEVFNPETDHVREKKNNHWKILAAVGVLVVAGAVATIVVLCCKGSPSLPLPQYLLVSSSGGAALEWPMKMGLYNLSKDTYNGHATYVKVTHCGQWWTGCDASSPDWEDKLDPQVIFVDKFGKWRIYMEIDPSKGGVRHPENYPTPDQPPEKGWLYKPKQTDWKPDVTLRVGISDCWKEGSPSIVRPCTF